LFNFAFLDILFLIFCNFIAEVLNFVVHLWCMFLSEIMYTHCWLCLSCRHSINMVSSTWVADQETSAARLVGGVCQSLIDMRQLAETTPPDSRLWSVHPMLTLFWLTTSVAYWLWGKSLVWLIGVVVCLLAAAQLQLFAGAGSRLLRNVPWYR